MNIFFELIFSFIPKCIYSSLQCFYQCPFMFLIIFILLITRFKRQLLRLVCRLDEESICKSHQKMPAPEMVSTDDEAMIGSDEELDGMIDAHQLPDMDNSSAYEEEYSPVDSSSASEY